ncbi:putative RNA-binding protein rnp24 [Halenospora varia]|nr:putative RNA-binding protein rnp24 [Halenospora varia]
MASSKHDPATLAESSSKKGKKEKKEKKEKSSKRKSSNAAERDSAPNSEIAPIMDTAMDIDDPSEKDTAKPKKEKSSKKRKAEALTETPVSKSDVSSDENVEEDASTPPADGGSESRPSKKRKSITIPEEIEVDITAPEPPSKKALRALKKGKPLPPSKSGAESTPEPEPKKAKTEVEKRSEHGVWIGNLPFFVSKDALRNFFVEKSDITVEMITRVHMPGPNDGKSANKVEEKKGPKAQHNKGFAYVDFSTAEGVTEALELSEQLLGGRRVLIKDNKSFEGRPLKTKEESRNDGKPPSNRIFLGNLPFDATEETVKEHFEKCGDIASIKVATFEDTGKCKGYAWIVFEELSAAESAVRGFIMEEEELSDSSESEEDSDSSESDSDEEKEKVVKKSKTKKTKKRKVWVNKYNGRMLRMEFAEDASVRYKKRYGKDGTKNNTGAGAGAEGNDGPHETRVLPSKKVEYRQDYAPRLTGGIVESKGKKVTF